LKRKYAVFGGLALVLAAVGGLLFYFNFSGGEGQALAVVNGEKITVEHFVAEIEKVQEPTRGMLKEEPAQFLDMMIMKVLVLQEAKKHGIRQGKEDKSEEGLIQGFLTEKFSSPSAVSKEEIAAFYELLKDRMEGKSLEDVAPMIEMVIRQQKQEEELKRFLEGLRSNAAVEINQERLNGLTAKPPDASTNTEEELAQALKRGRPVLVDFGSNSCLPCRQLRPILQEIRKEQEGKLEVLVIDINKYRELSKQYQIQLIPTLVFFDSNGKEAFRHQGFMPKTALMEELKKVGIS